MAIELNDSIRVLGAKPAEDKRLNNGVPYTSTAQANSLIILSDRYPSLEVLIVDKIYWYKGGVADVNLVEKLEGGGGTTNLSYVASPTQGTVESDTGTNAIIPLADGTNAGLLSPAEKVKIGNTTNTNSGDETTTSIQTKRPLKTVNGSSLEGTGDIVVEGVTINDTTPSSTQTYSSEKSEDTFVKRSGTEVGKPIGGDLEFSFGSGLTTPEADGLKSRIFSKDGKWYVEIIDGLDNPDFQFNPDKGLFASKLFDLENDENAYLQKGHIVQLEEDVFNLELANTGDETTASIQTKRPLKTVNGNSLEGSGNIVIIGGGGAVDSVNGQTGVVVLDADDIGETVTRVYVTPTEKTTITHSNRSILDNITEAFTTGLKTSYDSAVTWISTNGTNLLNHLLRTDNPHSVTKPQLGLGNVDDTSDVDKPISTATQTALDAKQATLTDTNFGTFTNSVENKETQANTDVLGYIDVTTGKWVKQPFSKLVDYFKGFFVDKTTAQSIDGVKTFIASPIVPTATSDSHAINFGQAKGLGKMHSILIDNNVGDVIQLTGTTVSTIVKSYTIPANFFTSDCVFETDLTISKIGTAGNITIGFGISPSGTTLPIHNVNAVASSQYINIGRKPTMIKNGKIVGFGNSGAFYSDKIANGALMNKASTFDPTIDNVFNLSIQLGNASDVALLENLTIKVYKND